MDEEYVIQKAKQALQTDPLSAKAWMLTAKTLYPNNFGVQFEAYKIEKCSGHVKETAKCFSNLIGKFQQQPEFWEEINLVTAALRMETESKENDFLCEMFKHISADVQHKLLLLTADHCKDIHERCKLLLLLLQRFPSAIRTHGSSLVETLLSHSLSASTDANCFHKLLVCDLLPLLNSQSNITLELAPKVIFTLLHKTLKLHISTLKENQQSNKDLSCSEPWSQLFCVIEFVGKQLGWDPQLVNFTNWTKENYWQRLMHFYQSANWDDFTNPKQLVYCLILFLIYCLHQYNMNMSMENYVMIEAFTDASLPSPQIPEHKAKKRKTEVDLNVPHLSTENSNKSITSNFMLAVNCWDLLHSTDEINSEFTSLSTMLGLEVWLSSFYIDYSIYKGKYEEALKRLDCDGRAPIMKAITKACIHYTQYNYLVAFENVIETLNLLPTNIGTTSTQLVVGGNQRHLHFLPLTKLAVLQFCSKLVLRSIRQKGAKSSDMAIGHTLVLMQIDWPQEEEMLPSLMEEISRAGSFAYPHFQDYLIQVDILEELAYLWSIPGGKITLDIVPNLTTRRMGTRLADKGMKDVIRQAIRKQISRCNEPIHELIHSFLIQEKLQISPTLN